MSQEIRRRIKQLFEDLPKSQQAVAEVILEEPESVSKMTIQELAQYAQTSPAAVMRFCQSIQMPSFVVLKNALSEDNGDDKLAGLEMAPNESLPLIKKKLLARAVQVMEDTLAVLSEETIQAATQMIEAADVIYVFGLGASYLVAKNFAQKWSRIGKVVICERDIHALATSFVSYQQRSLFIAISNSGRTRETVRLLQLAKQNGLATLAITQYGTNPLASKSDLAVQTVRPAELIERSAATNSLHAQFITIDTLFYYYAANRYDEVVATIHETRENVRVLNNL